jgi:hypothetical protein
MEAFMVTDKFKSLLPKQKQKNRKEYNQKRLTFLPLEERIVLSADVIVDGTGTLTAVQGEGTTPDFTFLDTSNASANPYDFLLTVNSINGSLISGQYPVELKPNGNEGYLNSGATEPSLYFPTAGTDTISYTVTQYTDPTHDQVVGTTTFYNTVAVTSPEIASTSPLPSIVAGSALPATQIVATFTALSEDRHDPFSASINWEDGTPMNPDVTSGLVVDTNTTDANGDEIFDVKAGHTYASPATYNPVITIMDNTLTTNIQSEGFSNATVQTTATDSITVLPSDMLSATPTAQVGYEGNATTFTLNFTDTNTAQSAGNFVVDINWGDGTVANPDISQVGAFGSTGNYVASSNHIYNLPNAGANGAETITYSIDLTGNAQADISGTYNINVPDAPLTKIAGATVQPIEGQSFTAAVATFTDANPNEIAADLSATINWGDGTTSAGIISEQSGVFTVTGTHTYATDGSFNESVTITDTGYSGTNESALSVSSAISTIKLWGVNGYGQLFSIGNYANETTAANTVIDYGNLYYNLQIGNINTQIPILGIDAFAVNSNDVAYMVVNNPIAPVLLSLNLNNVTPSEKTIDVNFVGFLNTLPQGDGAITSLAFNPQNPNALYALVQKGGSKVAEQLATIDINPADIHNDIVNINSLGAITGQGVSITNESGQALSFDSSGNLYVSDDANGILYKINPANGSILSVADNETNGLNTKSVDVTALAWDPTNNIMLDFNSQNESLGSLSLSNGNGSVFATMSGTKSIALRDALDDVVGMDFGF